MQLFDEEKLLKRAKELMREEITKLGGRGFKKKWKTEEAFIQAAVKAEEKRAEKLLRMLEKQGPDLSNMRKTKKLKLSSPADIARNKMKKPKKSRSPKNQKQSQSIRKAPRTARSASARRWKDLRESDGLTSDIITYIKDAEGNLIEKK